MHTPSASPWIGRLAWITIVVAVVITLWPESAAEVLTPAADWRVEGDDQAGLRPADLHHANHFLRDSVRLEAESRIWRTWSPGQGNRPLRLASPPFRAPPLLSIPVTGRTSGVSGPNAVWIEHVATGQRRPLYFGSTHGSINEVVVVVPPALVGEELVLRLESSGKRTVGTGSVFSVSWLAYAKSTFLGRLPVLLAAVLVYGFFLLVGGTVAASWDREDLSVPLALVSLGGFALAAFYAVPLFEAAGLPPLGAVRGACGAAGLAGAVALWAAGGSARERGWRCLRGYALGWLVVTLLVAAVCGTITTGTGHWEPNYRFWPATWSTDHEIPWRFAEGIRHGEPLATMFGDRWRPTDRPPLMAAAYLLVGDVIASLQACNDGPHLTGVFYNVAGIALNSLWIPVGYWLARAVMGLPRRAALGITLFAATVPYSFFTTTYGWPKAFGAAFALACFGLVIQERGARAGSAARIPCLAALAALSLLAHASTAGFLAPLAILFASGVRRDAWKPIAIGCLTTILLLGSWAAYKRALAPSHDPVLKYALTNDFGFERPGQTVFEAVRDRYAQLSLGAWLRLKGEMIVDTFTPMRSEPAQTLRNRAGEASRLAVLRAWDFQVPTFGNLAPCLAVLAVATVARRPRPVDSGDAAAVSLLRVSVWGMVTHLLLCLAPPMLHVLPHAAFFGLALGGGGCLARRAPHFFAFLLGAQLLYFAVVWLAHPLMHAVTFDASAFATTAVLVTSLAGDAMLDLRRLDADEPSAATTGSG